MAFLSSASKATKITLGTLAGVIVLIGVVPYIITWNQYKSVITDKVSEQLGREMQINGDIRFSILPRPEAHVSDILIKNPKGAASENFIQLKQLDVAVALLPLLAKNIEIEKITLVKPAITLEKMANGGNNWTFEPTKQEKKEDAKPTEADADTSLKINDIALEDAYIRYVDTPAKSIQTVGPINANVSLESLAGPYAAKGTLTYNNTPIAFDVKTQGKNVETGAMPLLADLVVGNKALNSHFDGTITSGGKLEVSGNLTAQSSDVPAVAAAFSADGKKPNLPQALRIFELKSQVLYSADKIALPGLQIKGDGLDVIADTVITTGKRTNVTMDIGRLVMPQSLIGGGANPAATNSNSSEPLVDTMRNGFNSAQAILDIAFPTTPLDIIITADAISLPGKPSIRDMRLAASSDTNQFTLQTFRAKLAGNTNINVTAKAPLNEAKKADQLSATLSLTSDNLSQAFAADGTAASGKDPINVSTTATLNRQALKLEPLQVTQQGQTLNGTVVYQPTADMPLNLALRGGVLNLDSLTGKTDADATAAATKPADTKAGSNSILNRLKGFKAQFDVAIDRIVTGGKNLRSVVAKGVFSDAGLNLQQAQANLEGLALSANGRIGQLSPVGDLDLTVQGSTSNLSQTMQGLGNKEARNLGATSFGGTVKGDLSKIALNIDAKLDQGTGKIAGNVLGVDTGKIGFDGKVNVNHPDTATIVRNFAKMSPTGALGPFGLDATVAYAGETIKADNFTLKLGTAGTVNGSVNLTPKQNGQKDINANIQADRLNLAALMGDETATAKPGAKSAPAAKSANESWSRDPINLEFIRTLNGKIAVKAGEILYKDFVIRNFNNDIAFAGGVMKLNDLSADLFDAGRLVVNGTLTAGTEGKAHNGQFNVDVKDTDAVKFFKALDSELFAKGSFSAQQQLNFNGASPYQIINSLNGDGQFKLRDAVVNGLDLDALAAKMDRPNSVSDFTGILQQAKAGGTTTIGDVDVPVSIRNGVATIAQTTVKTKLTETAFGGTADLPSKTVNMGGQIRFVEQGNMPPLGLKITGPFSAPRKEFDNQSVTKFLIQKGTAKYQDKAIEKLDKLIGDRIPGGANGQLGGAIGNLLGLPTSKATSVPAVPAPESTTNISPAETATPVTVPVQAVPEPTPAPASVETPAATPVPAAAPADASQTPASPAQ